MTPQNSYCRPRSAPPNILGIELPPRQWPLAHTYMERGLLLITVSFPQSDLILSYTFTAFTLLNSFKNEAPSEN